MQHPRRKSELSYTKSVLKKTQLLYTSTQPLPINSLITLEPFSDDCTLNQIEKGIQAYIHPMQNKGLNNVSQVSSQSFLSRLTNIVKKQKKRSHTNQSVSEQQNENQIKQFQTVISKKPIEQKKHKLMIKKIHTIFKKQSHSENKSLNDVRHKIDTKVFERAESQYQILDKLKSESLLINFNKNSCYLFSRSKQKIIQVEKQMPRQVKQIQNKNSNKFQGFGNLFYRNYLKKYDQRKHILGPKGSLMKMATQ